MDIQIGDIVNSTKGQGTVISIMEFNNEHYYEVWYCKSVGQYTSTLNELTFIRRESETSAQTFCRILELKESKTNAGYWGAGLDVLQNMRELIKSKYRLKDKQPIKLTAILESGMIDIVVFKDKSVLLSNMGNNTYTPMESLDELPVRKSSPHSGLHNIQPNSYYLLERGLTQIEVEKIKEEVKRVYNEGEVHLLYPESEDKIWTKETADKQFSLEVEKGFSLIHNCYEENYGFPMNHLFDIPDHLSIISNLYLEE